MKPQLITLKDALNKNLAVTQSNLAKCKVERDFLRTQLNGALMQAEMSERSARDVARDRDMWRERATKAEAALAAAGITTQTIG